jgi:pimeloyl-ACP methyl ester carboxylesterase
MEVIREMIASTDPNGYCGCCAVLRETDLRADVASIQVLCLVIAGTHDRATPPSDAQALCAALRNARYGELDAAHLSAWERADEFANAVLAFLDKGDPRNG